MSTKDLRQEYIKLRNSTTFKDLVGTTCVNCGSDECIEYHHIVPLSLGGTNRLSNIIPLCHRCHCAAHKGRHISHYIDLSNSGRKPKVPDEEAFAIYDRWVDGQFGSRRCQQLLDLEGSTRPSATEQYKRYIDARGIKSIRHNYDFAVTVSPHSVDEKRMVGKVTYLDGREEPIMFKDFGENDDIEYTFRFRSREKEDFTMTWGEFKKLKLKDSSKKKSTSKKRRKSNAYSADPAPVIRKSVVASDFIGKLKESETTITGDTSKMRGRDNPLYGTVVTMSIPAERISSEEKRSRDAWWKEYRKKLRAEAAGM